MGDQNTILIVTHDLRAALSVADMIWVMAKGPNGSTIAHELDLAAHGFAWEEDAYADKEFMVVEKELSGMF